MLPIIICFLHGKGEVRFFCQFCNCYHYHGCDPELRKGKKSHRVSHCSNLHYDGGYYIKLPSKKDVKDTLDYGYK